MRKRVLAAAAVACALFAAEYAFILRPHANRVLLESIAAQLKYAYHDCVPLGWEPVPVRGTYYPGYTASLQTYAEWLDALWRGRIDTRDLNRPGATEVFNVLNHLAHAGLLERRSVPGAFDYYLTTRALPYYYASSTYHDNRDSLPYLCYSTIVPDRVVWLQLAGKSAKLGGRWYTVSFEWKPGSTAAWANDWYIRAHSVVLPPLRSPVTAKLFYRNGNWNLASVYDRTWMLPAITAQAARPREEP